MTWKARFIAGAGAKRKQIPFFRRGVLGENRQDLLSIRGIADPAAQELVNSENSDRMTIYQALAQKNGTSLQEIQKAYTQRLGNDAPSGTPVENPNGQWQKKWMNVRAR